MLFKELWNFCFCHQKGLVSHGCYTSLGNVGKQCICSLGQMGDTEVCKIYFVSPKSKMLIVVLMYISNIKQTWVLLSISTC